MIIPATDRPATLQQVVQAIERATSPPEEVIVVDEPAELFSGAARNIGARRATGETLVFVDADVEVHQDAFVRIRAAFDLDPGLTAIFGAYDDNPTSGSLLSDFRNLLHHCVHSEGAGPPARSGRASAPSAETPSSPLAVSTRPPPGLGTSS